MGYSKALAKTNVQLQRIIQRASKDSRLVVITQHAAERMVDRNISRSEVDNCMRIGCIHRAPEPNRAMGSLECRMEGYVAGRHLAVIVAICDEDPSMIVVTAMKVKKERR